jgi:hypothetical protein
VLLFNPLSLEAQRVEVLASEYCVARREHQHPLTRKRSSPPS